MYKNALIKLGERKKHVAECSRACTEPWGSNPGVSYLQEILTTSLVYWPVTKSTKRLVVRTLGAWDKVWYLHANMISWTCCTHKEPHILERANTRNSGHPYSKRKLFQLCIITVIVSLPFFIVFASSFLLLFASCVFCGWGCCACEETIV